MSGRRQADGVTGGFRVVEMSKVSFHLLIGLQALAYGAGLLVATGLVMQWGEWYAPWEDRKSVV